MLGILLQNPNPIPVSQINRLFDYGVLGVMAVVFIYGTFALYRQISKQWQSMIDAQKATIDALNVKIEKLEKHNEAVEVEFRNYLKDTAAMSINLQEEHNKILNQLSKVMERHNENDSKMFDLMTVSTSTLKYAMETMHKKQ